MDIIQLMKNPLTQSGRSGDFLRLVLAEAVSYGMPARVVATLDDVGAMLGFYDPLPTGQAGHLASPLVHWSTDRRQPTIERITDLEELAMKQRALIAFGGAPPDHMVGTAEIVIALGNCHKEAMPPHYYEVWTWASADAMSTLSGARKEQIRKDNNWNLIHDDEVLRPAGRLNPTYIEIATSIRRSAIGSVKADAQDDPRVNLRPVAVYFLRSHLQFLREAEAAGADSPAYANIAFVRRSVAGIYQMFPDITQSEIDDLGRKIDDPATKTQAG